MNRRKFLKSLLVTAGAATVPVAVGEAPIDSALRVMHETISLQDRLMGMYAEKIIQDFERQLYLAALMQEQGSVTDTVQFKRPDGYASR